MQSKYTSGFVLHRAQHFFFPVYIKINVGKSQALVEIILPKIHFSKTVETSSFLLTYLFPEI